MKVAIDTQTTMVQKSGFGFYVQNLVDNLAKVGPKNEYLLISPKTNKDLSTPQRWIWDQIQFPRQAKRAKVDLLHQPCFSAPIFYRGKVVVTCNDLISIFFPENLPLASRLFYSKWEPYSYRRADHIIAISEHTKKDILALLKIPEEKITVIPLAASKEFRPIKSPKKLRSVQKKYKTGSDYILHVSTIEPRKNLPFLVRAYALAVREGIDTKLVITGKKGWYYDNLFKLVDELNLQDKVIFTGYVADVDMPALYSGAKAFVFPSQYEGFGLPPLEAMACGTPVISSNTSSMPEVIGNAGILISPKDERVWARNIINVLKDKGLAKNMSGWGLRQAKKFSWAEAAEKTIEVYEKVLKL
jgi:glycosyltransferase involved in cell wall biosynthesis